MITYVLGILMVTMTAQAALGWFQIKRMYQSIEDLKKACRHTPNILAAGFAKSGLAFRPGVIVLVVVNHSEEIVDYYEMKGRTVFSKFHQKKGFIGCSAKDAKALMKKKNEKAAYASALKQIAEKRKTAVCPC
ncbi:transcriptional regulator GutM [Anaerostipes sp.]|uniref:transcriptional regulator GutM n=1 Tax=Anaerostipes sp. TaxID=1872530 RepID=UPI0025BC6D91|nr:transcriptional regulator GutM [Anaerostipes sp.]MBS7008800.1 transcriptional regulator [Anaerostipes sp.]